MFLENIAVSLTHQAQRIARNLVCNIDINNTLKFAKENQQSLLHYVEIKDPHNQPIAGTPLQIIYAAGDCDSRNGLLKRLRPCFSEIPLEYNRQIEEWRRRNELEQGTKKTMAPYVQALKTLRQEIADSKDEVWRSRSSVFTKLLNSPMVKKFRSALTPSPDHLVTSGSLFDFNIFVTFIEEWEKLKNELKRDFFAAVAYGILQSRVQYCDIGIFQAGIHRMVYENAQPAERMDFTSGVPESLIGLGETFFFDPMGRKFLLSRDWDIVNFSADIWGVFASDSFRCFLARQKSPGYLDDAYSLRDTYSIHL